MRFLEDSQVPLTGNEKRQRRFPTRRVFEREGYNVAFIDDGAYNGEAVFVARR